MKKLTLKITASDITKGVGANCHACPIAQAIIRLEHPVIISVGPTCIMFGSTYGLLIRSDTPAKVRQFMLDFDSGKTVKPFQITLTFK